MEFSRSALFDVLIVIPTVATPEVLIPSFGLLCRRLDGLRVHVVLSINPLVPANGIASRNECERLWVAHQEQNTGCALTVIDMGRPLGFGGAINRGLREALLRDPGLPRLTVIWNDDLRVTPGWLKGMINALGSDTVEEWAEVPNATTGRRPLRAMVDYLEGSKGIGLIGPVTNCAAGIQNIPQEHQEAFQEMGVDAFAEAWRENNQGCVLTADFLSGYCLGITRPALRALSVSDAAGQFAWLFDERYVVAGYEDNDLCVRAMQAGFRQVVAAEVFIGHLGHQTFDAAFPEMGRGMRNRLIYYDRWHQPPKAERLTGCYRVRLEVPSDINYLRMSLVRHGSLLDSAVFLFTANPALVLQSPEVKEKGLHWLRDSLGTKDADFLMQCNSPSGEGLCRALETWAASWLHTDLPNTPSRKPKVFASLWTGAFHEREERNALLAFAEQATPATWLFSIDHDEVLEPRVTRTVLERLFRHPDPLVGCWDIAFLNHWENNRLYRVDRPWGDGGTWTGGMRGYRLFKVNKTAPRRILAGGHNGLHCGNVPGSDWSTKRVAGFTFRHFGYMQYADRVRKEKRYNQQDPNPDPLLVGGNNYNHITEEGNLHLSPFVQESGIGLHMLVYSGESADDLGRMFDQVYGLVDAIVLVWTEETPLDPTSEIARMAAHFGVEWVHQPLNNDLAAARNAGINALQGRKGLGWSWFMDPDEQLPEHGPIVIRRMAQCSDNWAWQFRFVNPLGDGQQNLSESVRLARLDPQGIMRLSGRVHESFEAALRGLREQGIARTLKLAPELLLCHNRGLTGTPESQQAKLERYRTLTELELAEHPDHAGAWVTLGLYWANMQEERLAEECFSRAVVVEQGQYLPYQELSLLYLRRGRRLLEEAIARMGQHPMQQPWRKLVEILNNSALVMPLLGAPTVEGYVSPIEGLEEGAKLALLPALAPPAEEAKPLYQGSWL